MLFAVDPDLKCRRFRDSELNRHFSVIKGVHKPEKNIRFGIRESLESFNIGIARLTAIFFEKEDERPAIGFI